MPDLIKCTDKDFLEGARKFRKELLRLPVRRLMENISKFATIRAGIRFEEKLFTADADMQFGPYDPKRTEDLAATFAPRVLRSYFGSVRREFDPNQYYQTIFSSPTTKGEGLKSVEIARLVLSILAGKLGDHLLSNIFTAVRNDAGTDTKDLFNGWDTQTANAITAGDISTANGNLYAFGAAIDATNAVDMLKAFVRQADDFLIEKPSVNLLVPYSVYHAYLDDYQATVGAVPYNREYNKYFVEGHTNVHIMPLAQKKGSEYIHLTTKDNMLVAVNQVGEEEQIVVEKHDVVLLTFFATIFFGTDFEQLDSHRMCVGKLVNA